MCSDIVQFGFILLNIINNPLITREKTISTETPDILIKIRGLSFSRGDRLIFDNIDMDIARGKVTAIMGPSGTGKTTLLKLIGGQLRPDSGTIHVDGENVHILSQSALYKLRRRTMGMLFQSGALLTDLTVFDNVAFPWLDCAVRAI